MKHTELLNIQTSAKKTGNKNSSSKELVKREDVKGTPFVLVKNDGWFLVLGKYIVTEKFKTKKEALSKTDGIDWELLGRVVGILIEAYGESNKDN